MQTRTISHYVQRYSITNITHIVVKNRLSQALIIYLRRVMQSPDCAHMLHNLKIAHTDCAHVLYNLQIVHTCYTISRLCTRVIQSPDCAHVLYNLQIVHTCYAISRLISRLPAQSRDSENAQHNLEIAQILRLRRTYMCPAGTWWY